MDFLENFNRRDLFGWHIGARVIEAGDGRAIAEMELKEFHLNGVGTVHGGAIFTLADLVFAAASNSNDQIAVAIHVSVSFIKAGGGQRLRAEAKEVSKSRKIATYNVAVTDEDGDLIASFEGMAYRKNAPYPRPDASPPGKA